jgi:hypothetical protein
MSDAIGNLYAGSSELRGLGFYRLVGGPMRISRNGRLGGGGGLAQI